MAKDPIEVVRARLRVAGDPMYQQLVRWYGKVVETTSHTMGVPPGVAGILVDFADPTHREWTSSGNAVIAVAIGGWPPRNGQEEFGRPILTNLPLRMWVNRVHLKLSGQEPSGHQDPPSPGDGP
jgi:hypothetical protein